MTRKIPPEEILKKRQEWRKEAEKHIPRRNNWDSRGDAIVRDIDRMDYYLHENPKKAYASYAWFRVEVKDVTYRGIECFVSMPEMIIYDKQKKKWRLAERDEQDGTLAYPVGKIPYENIVNIDWNGDEYYPYPHIYCRYRKGSPYYAIHYYVKRGSEEHGYFEQIENFEPHKKRFRFL